MKGDLQAHLSTTSTEWFLTKNSMTPRSHPPYSQGLAQVTSFVSLDEKSYQGKCFANVEKVKQKMSVALKGIKISKYKNVLSSGGGETSQ